MATILITSGPTRQYLDPVRYLTNASSGRMGAALAGAALDLGHDVIVLTGPVNVDYPAACEVVSVVTTSEMLAAAVKLFARCDGCIGAAAPCDYQPQHYSDQKIAKNGRTLSIDLIETPDVVATLGQLKRGLQWVVGFALETEDRRFRATVKLEKKHCDLIVSNGPAAIDSDRNSVELLAADGSIVAAVDGTKPEVAAEILSQIERLLMQRSGTLSAPQQIRSSAAASS